MVLQVQHSLPSWHLPFPLWSTRCFSAGLLSGPRPATCHSGTHPDLCLQASRPFLDFQIYIPSGHRTG